MIRTALLLILLCFWVCLFANDEPVNLKRITYSQGLSENTVMDIAQEPNGYIWVATREGLNRYDGYSCKNYFAENAKAGSLRSSSIFKIFIDSKSHIWVQNAVGTDTYLPQTDSFEPLNIAFNGKENISVFDVLEAAGTKWLATPSGILGLSPGETKVIKSCTKYANVLRFCPKVANEFWVYAAGKIHLFNAEKEEYSETQALPFKGEVNEMVWFNQYLWLYADRQLWVYDGESVRPFSSLAKQLNYDKHSLVDKIDEVLITSLKVLNDELWISSDGNGLFVLKFEEGLSIRNITTNTPGNSISTNAVRCLFVDSDKNLWMGMVHNGLNLLPAQQKKFFSSQYTDENPDVPNGNFSNFLEDKNNVLWATSFDGLCVLNHNDLSIKRFVEKGAVINTMTMDWNGDIFLGTYNKGLLKYSPLSNKLVKIESERFKLNGSINALFTDHKGNVWIGTDVLYRYDVRNDEIELIDKSGFYSIISMLETKEGAIWIGTVNGLYLYNAEYDEVEAYNTNRSRPYTISNNWVNCLFEDSKGNIWLGTNGGGINRISIKNHELTIFEKNEKLLSNVVHGIAEDKQGNIWFTTNSGLVKLNPVTEAMHVFDYSDGLINNQYIDESIFLTSKGKMLCGGEKGIDYFIPENIKTNLNPPRVIVNGSFFEEKELRDKEGGTLRRQLSENDTLTFKYNQSYFGFEFTGIDFANSEKIKYAYCLEGFNNDWIYETESRTVNYGHVPPGSYTFKVKAANSDGVWSNEADIKVVVKPPFAKTPLAYVIYFAGLLLVFYIFYRYKLERKLLKNKIQYESKERKRVEELNQFKLRLFTHISHEFRTPLSLIVAPVQELIKHFKQSGQKFSELELIQNNAQKLQVLVNQVLEVRKIESGSIELQLTRLEMVSFVKYCCESFQNLAKQKKIKLNFESQIESLEMLVDQSLIEKVVYNLLSNAIKYTHQGQVNIFLKINEDKFCLEVVDSGIGIAKEHQEKLFEMFYRVNRKEENVEGSGIGLALCKELLELHKGSVSVQSKVGEGSCFTACLPLNSHKELLKNTTKPFSSKKTELAKTEVEDKQKRLLLVDDNDELRIFLSEKLREVYSVIEASNGKQALEIAKQNQPHIIISDVMMPEMDGWELCQAVKTDVEISHIPLVLLTALNETENKIKGLEIGADAYLEKPFSVDHIVTLVNNILARREKLKARYRKGEAEDDVDEQLTAMDRTLLQNALRYTQENLSRPDFSVQILSDLMGMSRVNLHLKLKALCDLSPSEYIMNIRLQESLKLLKERKYQISEIADLTGFSTASHFSRVFKKQFGGTPSDFSKGKFSI